MRATSITMGVLGMVAVLAVVGAAEPHVASIGLEQPWVRRAPAMPDGQARTAAYLVIRNRGRAPDALVAATADVAERIEIHETRNVSGMMMMEPVERIAVMPGARIELKPGGYHLMLIGLKRALVPPDAVALTLVFERAGSVTARAKVR